MYNKTIWSEGMFLQPQHFQQHDRFIEHLFRNSFNLFQSYAWGFNMLELDHEILSLGKIGLKRCQGIFPDGTFIDIPNAGLPPIPLEVSLDTTNSIVYLAMPLRDLGLPDATEDNKTNQPIRYVAKSVSIQDNTSDQINDTVLVTIGLPRLCLLTKVDTAAYSCLGIAKVEEVVAGKGIHLNKSFIPPMLNANNQPILMGYINELKTMIYHRSKTFTHHITDMEKRADMDEMVDFMILQLMNRYTSIFDDLSQSVLTHPHAVYSIFAQLLGEVVTFTSKNIPKSFSYSHDNLSDTFMNLMGALRASFSMIANQYAHSLPLEQSKPGFWVAKVTDKNMLDTHDFVLAVQAQVSPEILRHEFPQVFKISALEELADLVVYALPGIRLDVLPTIPRKIPFYEGYTYFLLNQQTPLWDSLKTSSALAFHLSAPFPELRLELWATQRINNQLPREE